jgi:predicted Fe-Mo cluster-binding NifX family protein
VIYDAVAGSATRAEYRQNGFTAHARGECNGEEHSHGHEHHSHGPLIDALSDCEALVSRGMGPRLVADLAERGIRPYACHVTSVEEAAELFARDALPANESGGCCHHK